jgi:p-hydroxybenzoate 3-monooxygenase
LRYLDFCWSNSEMSNVIKTQVAIVGAGPSGLLLGQLLAKSGIDFEIVENRDREYTVGRVRAGVLEQGAVELMVEAGVGERLMREGLRHDGIYLQFDGERHRVPFHDLIGRSVWVYGQQEVMKDLLTAHDSRGYSAHYSSSDVTIHDLLTDTPSVTFSNQNGETVKIEADFVVGADGFHGVSRPTIPGHAITHHDRVYPFGWLGILATVKPSTDELIYALHEDGFAMHSMRSDTVSRLYIQVDPEDKIENWSDERIWEHLQTRLGYEGWTLAEGPIFEKGITPMRSWVSNPMRYGKLFLAGDSAHIVPPTGAKGLNSAIGDVEELFAGLLAHYRSGKDELLEGYSETALKRIWRTQNFSMRMTTMLHRFFSDDAARDNFDYRSQLGELRNLVLSEHGMAYLAENYTGIRRTTELSF